MEWCVKANAEDGTYQVFGLFVPRADLRPRRTWGTRDLVDGLSKGSRMVPVTA